MMSSCCLLTSHAQAPSFSFALGDIASMISPTVLRWLAFLIGGMFPPYMAQALLFVPYALVIFNSERSLALAGAFCA
jgi:hypothetical protein